MAGVGGKIHIRVVTTAYIKVTKIGANNHLTSVANFSQIKINYAFASYSYQYIHVRARRKLISNLSPIHKCYTHCITTSIRKISYGQ